MTPDQPHRLVLDLAPMAQPRPRFSRRGGKVRTYEPARATAWKNSAALVIRSYLNRLRGQPRTMTGPVRLNLNFYLATKTHKHHTPAWKSPLDVDNMAKAIMDAMTTAGVWEDDRQVVALVCAKWWAPKGSVEVQWWIA